MAACTTVVLVRAWPQYWACRMCPMSLGWVSGAQSASRGHEDGVREECWVHFGA